ncbi:(2Fe-2S)-binding protein [Ferrovibrio sp.]|uniref:(2Fe-2S)-binding protein n=1 Tax=Ferrovibrio sp. TaxID=1917215 RepID=UPI003D288782
MGKAKYYLVATRVTITEPCCNSEVRRLQPAISIASPVTIDDARQHDAWGETRINGAVVPLRGEQRMAVAAFLRDVLDLKGTKIGCGNGECGACTIVVNGDAICSCLLPLHRLDGAEVVTIEGLSRDGALHPIQAALKDFGAFQCGYCTPGVTMSLFALFSVDPQPEEMAVLEALQGNICRCSGYVKLLEAVDALRRSVAG